MKIKSVTLAWACVVLLVLYMVLGLLIWTLFDPNNHGVLAALFAAGAGTAILVGVTLEFPELRGQDTDDVKALFALYRRGLWAAVCH